MTDTCLGMDVQTLTPHTPNRALTECPSLTCGTLTFLLEPRYDLDNTNYTVVESEESAPAAAAAASASAS